MFQQSTFILKLGSRQNLVMLLTSTLPKSYWTTSPAAFFWFFEGLQVNPEALMPIIPRLQAVTYLSSTCVMVRMQYSSLQGRLYSAKTGSQTLERGKMEVAPQHTRAKRKMPPSLMVALRVLGMLLKSPVRLRQCQKSTNSQTGPTRQAGTKFTQPRQVMQLGFQTTRRLIWDSLSWSMGLAPFWQLQARPMQLNSCIMKIPVMSKGFYPQLRQSLLRCRKMRARKHWAMTICPTYFRGERMMRRQATCCWIQRTHLSWGKRIDWKPMVRAMVMARKTYLLQMRERRQERGTVMIMIRMRSAWSSGSTPTRGFCNISNFIKKVDSSIKISGLQQLSRVLDCSPSHLRPVLAEVGHVHGQLSQVALQLLLFLFDLLELGHCVRLGGLSQLISPYLHLHQPLFLLELIDLAFKVGVVVFQVLDVLSVVLGLVCHLLHLELQLLHSLHLSLQLVNIVLTLPHLLLEDSQLAVGAHQTIFEFVDDFQKLLFSLACLLRSHKTLTRLSSLKDIFFFLELAQVLKLFVPRLQC